MSTIYSKKELAIKYCEMGIQIIPIHHVLNGKCSCDSSGCTSKGKHPHNSQGSKETMSNLSQVEYHWRTFKEDNVGIVTGKANNLVVLDIDPRHEGDKSLTKLEDQYGKLDTTNMVFTGGGGKHYYFKLPASVVIKNAINILPGIDIRGEGGYAVAPPSDHVSGKSYQWNNEVINLKSLKPFPQFLIDLIQSKKKREVTLPIREGNRNNYLAHMAGKIRLKYNCDENELFERLKIENFKNCNPSLEEGEVYKIAQSISRYEKIMDSDDDNDGKKTSVSTAILLMMKDIELFHTKDHEPYAILKFEDHKEFFYLRSSSFKRHCTQKYFREKQKAPNSKALTEAIDTLCARACCEGIKIETSHRVGGDLEILYYDLGNEKREIIEITKDSWKIVHKNPPYFIHPKNMEGNNVALDKGDINLLKKYINVQDDQWPLYIGWLIGTFHPTGPYPILILEGEQASAKSTLAKISKRLIDPTKSNLRSMPQTESDLCIAAIHNWVLAFDNLSGLSKDMSDSLCRLSTDGGMGKRALYTDNEEVTFEGRRPVILNGIDNISTRGDLLSRSIVLHLKSISETERKEEEFFEKDFEKDKPLILAGILDALVLGLKNLPTTKLDKSPRMANFAKFVTACESGLGIKTGLFLELFMTNNLDAEAVALSNDSVCQDIISIMQDTETFESTASELLKTLRGLHSRMNNNDFARLKTYPHTASSLSNHLKRFAPLLRKVHNLDITWEKKTKGRQILIVNNNYNLPSSPSEEIDLH